MYHEKMGIQTFNIIINKYTVWHIFEKIEDMIEF